MPGRARSASVIDRPQVGQATQAIDQRRTVGDLVVQLDAVLAQDGLERLPVARLDVGKQDALMRRQADARLERGANFARSAVLSRKSPSSWMRPFSTFSP